MGIRLPPLANPDYLVRLKKGFPKFKGGWKIPQTRLGHQKDLKGFPYYSQDYLRRLFNQRRLLFKKVKLPKYI